MVFKVELQIVGLNAERAADKLVRGGVAVHHARKVQKNVLLCSVERKDRAKAFAILQGSCYNIKKVRPVGGSALLRAAVRCAGLLAGGVLFLCTVLFVQSRVLRVDVVGSGAYYRQEVLRVLDGADVRLFSPPPRAESALVAQLLALPRVSFCAMRHAGGVLTVQIEVADEAPPLAQGALCSPVAGTVESLIVARGVPLVQVGAEVAEDAPLVAPQAGEYVIARAVIRYFVSAEFEGSEREARAAAYLTYGTMQSCTLEQTERGWRVTGFARAQASCNLG